ncbi:hypothetical protein MRX96_015557 [Rhipicephalus microplus]
MDRPTGSDGALQLGSPLRDHLGVARRFFSGGTPYFEVLRRELASSEAGVSELWLSNISELSYDTASVLFSALASSEKIQHLML